MNKTLVGMTTVVAGLGLFALGSVIYAGETKPVQTAQKQTNTAGEQAYFALHGPVRFFGYTRSWRVPELLPSLERLRALNNV
ncbi:MAG: hypothetical protein IID43_02175, partial [Planctomycetes bacterium]|nr:hypothetical protein [Planctomycetota bacterium]